MAKKHDRPRSKWTKKVVETLWHEMTKNQHLRTKGKTEAWWAHIAKQLNAKHNISVTGKACGGKACAVAGAGRPYPWHVDTPPAEVLLPVTGQVSTTALDMIQIIDRIERLERTLIDVVKGLIEPTPNITPAVNQLWVSRARRPEANNAHVAMRVTSIINDEVTLSEVGGIFLHTVPSKSFHKLFSHIGFATVNKDPIDALGDPPPMPVVDPIDAQTPAAPTAGNGTKDLSWLLGT